MDEEEEVFGGGFSMSDDNGDDELDIPPEDLGLEEFEDDDSEKDRN
jgi:hypothetical protein